MSDAVTTKALLVPFGLLNGQLTHVSSVERGLGCGCTCVNCGGDLVARKGQIRTAHFAHAVVTPDCNAETLLHKLAKQLLFKRIKNSIANRTPLLIRWRCGTCFNEHEKDLVRYTTDVRLEETLGSVRPDILLLRGNGRPYIAVEIVVTHPPEESTLAFYAEGKITCVQFSVSTISDLENLVNSSVLNPSDLGFCPSPPPPPHRAGKCACGGELIPRFVVIAKVPCWKCGASYTASYVTADSTNYLPAFFLPAEIAFARKNGVRLERHYNNFYKQSMSYNICPHCERHWGNEHGNVLWATAEPVSTTHIMSTCDGCRKPKKVLWF